ncbi:hypothetical protein E0Z10_g8232 [Xylaria hypoxylon]|uniref:Uncharacterized protein n=1 Tax=Xylaria hypoxylon TaxID=37992 RepID=A0A4Z0YBY2_9PEZI|nr:hypothetical protein E0Z10_g8232 [Xylaria hypoxylon]
MTPTSQDAGRVQCDSSDWEEATNEHPASSKHRLEGTENPSSSRVESLPAELRVLLLSSMPDLPTLRSLVRASPVLHAQYRHDRNSILRACLGRELDGFLIDAYATAMSRARELGPRTDKTITDYLNIYQTWLVSSTSFPNIKSIDPGRIRWMVAYHISVARPLARLYSNWALANLKRAVLSSTGQQGAAAPDDHDIQLSRSEEIRVFRALYRYETYHHLFGQNQGQRQGGFRHHEIHDLFFCLFDPWEAEAVGCFHVFVRHKYEDIFNRVKADLHPRNARFRLENGVYNPDGSHDLEIEHDDYMDGTVARGLKMTARLLAIDDHEKLVSKMQRCLTHSRELDAPMRQALGSVAQNDRREMSTNFPNARDKAEQRRDPIHFVGDAVPPDGPPFAWVVLWGGKYSNIYGEYVPQSVRLWGYVMWDERRWIDMGADENLVARQWETSPDLVEEIETDYNWRPVGC